MAKRKHIEIDHNKKPWVITIHYIFYLRCFRRLEFCYWTTEIDFLDQGIIYALDDMDFNFPDNMPIPHNKDLSDGYVEDFLDG